jgi:hypothetical protein
VKAPEISVAIASRRRARLAFALAALAAQTLERGRFEVVVVRDPGAGAAPPPPPGLEVRFETGSRGGNIAALRDQAWRAARAPLIAFTDDDCRPAERWLERLAAAADPMAIVQGRTEPDPDEAHLLHGLARSQRIVGPSAWYQACNILYHRSLLERLGGFDAAFGPLGEDADLGLRARAAGAELRYVDDAVVRHAVLPRSIPAAAREAWRRDTIPLLVSKHPEQREALYLRAFWRPSHALLALGLLGLVGARRHPALAIAIAPYLKRTVDPPAAASRSPRAYLRRVAHLPARLLVDAVETFATARAAARRRVLVL